MLKKIIIALFIFALLYSSIPYAQEKKPQEMPLAKVVVAEVRTGMVAPESEFIGTFYYQEKSEVASEVDGKVEAVNFEEGQRVKKGDVLVKLSSDLLEKTLLAAKASHEQVLSDLEKAIKDLKRAENLYKEELIPEQSYDEHNFRVKSLEKKAASLKADVEHLEIKLKKKVIRAPYDSIVIQKHVDRGEWLSAGDTATTVAKDDVMVPVVEVPERIIKFIKIGSYVNVKVMGKTIKGKVVTIVPRGDISTRTFPVKIGVQNTLSLIEGMEARVILPIGQKQQTLTVSRDAVISMFGMTVVFAVIDSKATMIPVKVIGYEGMTVGIHAEGLEEGMEVVVKGNERLRDGQPVEIINEK